MKTVEEEDKTNIIEREIKNTLGLDGPQYLTSRHQNHTFWCIDVLVISINFLPLRE